MEKLQLSSMSGNGEKNFKGVPDGEILAHLKDMMPEHFYRKKLTVEP